MKTHYRIFLIGAVLAFPIPLIDDLVGNEEFIKNPSYFESVQTGATYWMFIYLVLIGIIILIRLISSWSAKLSERQRLVLTFFSGHSFGFVIIRLVTFEF